MKKTLFIAAIAAIAATSCAKEETVTSVASGEVISFKSYTSGTTKASSLTTETILGETFEVDSYRTNNGYFGAKVSASNIQDEELYYDLDVTDTWKVDNIYFWPVSDEFNEYVESFFAVNLSGVMNDVSDTTDYPSFEYTIATDAADMDDIIVANYMNETEGYVKLNFYHALAKVNFQIQGSDNGGGDGINTDIVDYYYELKSLTVKNLYETGTFTFNGDASACPGAWVADITSGGTSYVYALPDSCIGTNDGEIILKMTDIAEGDVIGTDDDGNEIYATADDVTSDNSLLIMPQANTTFTVEIEYTVSYDGGQIYPTDGISIAKADVEISNLTFAPSSNTIIKLVIQSPGDIIAYAVELEDWDDVDDTDDDYTIVNDSASGIPTEDDPTVVDPADEL